MKFRHAMFLVLAVFILCTAGCSSRVGDFTIISTKNVDIGSNYVKVASQADGSDIKPIIVVFPMGTANIKAAIDDILRKNDGDLVTDVVIDSSYWYIPYVFGQTGFTVKGDVWKKAKKVSQLGLEEKMKMVKTDLQNATDVYTVQRVGNKIKLTSIAKSNVKIDQSNANLVVSK